MRAVQTRIRQRASQMKKPNPDAGTGKEPWLSLNRFLRRRFGQRVQKIPVDAGLSCPNRDPETGAGGCIYCNQHGSGTGAWKRGIDIKSQVLSGIKWARRRYGAERYLVYFQSYSNTFAPLDRLEEIYQASVCHEGIVGVCIGTRPDCIDEDRLDLIARIFKDKMVWMEYGLQSSSDETLKRINRGHKAADFIRAVELTRNYPFFICAHVIFGLPGETERDMEATVRLLSELKVDGVKFHQLYVVEGTAMAELLRAGRYRPMSQRAYALMVARAIRMLPKGTVIQRLTGDPAPGELLAPEWSKDKQGTIELIRSFLDSSSL